MWKLFPFKHSITWKPYKTSSVNTVNSNQSLTKLSDWLNLILTKITIKLKYRTHYWLHESVWNSVALFSIKVVHSYDISNDSDEEDSSDHKEELYTTQALATLTKTQAIAVVNLWVCLKHFYWTKKLPFIVNNGIKIFRYCSSLPHDIFTVLTPYWWKQKVDDSVICKLQFPMNAAIKNMIVVSPRTSILFSMLVMCNTVGVHEFYL